MARPDYDLQIQKTITLESSNGTVYTARIWGAYSGDLEDWRLSSNGIRLDWETAEVQDKNSPILASKLTLDVLVENATQATNIAGFSSRQERDVWVTLNFGSTGSLLWAGYLIPNLDKKEDVSYPYISTLVFVDGIAGLKEKPFIRETNTQTSAVPTFPYVKADTFANAGYRRIIGGSTTWVEEIIDDIGMVLSSDEAIPGAGLENYTIQTAVNWWNEDMNVGPQSEHCPLSQIKLSMVDLYEVNEHNEYTVPNTYEVLKYLCKTFNMRFFYWEHTFHFIQIAEYSTDEESSAPYTSPVNIPTREFYYTGTAKTYRDYFGTTTFSLYNQEIETGTTNSGLQKLATTAYDALPAIKRTQATYAEMAGNNYFNGFPLFLTHNTVSGLPTTWPTDNASHAITQFSQSDQVYNVMTLTDADQLDGFRCKIYCTTSNTANVNLWTQVLFTIRAKPTDSAWEDADNMTLYKDRSASPIEYKWQSAVGEFPLSNNQDYLRKYVPFLSNENPIQQFYNVDFDAYTDPTDGLLPTDSAFTGSWDFQFYTFTEYDNDATRPMYAYNQGNSGYSHGLTQNSPLLNAGSNYAGTSLSNKWGYTPTFYAIDYEDSISPSLNGGVYFYSQFVPVKTAGIHYGTQYQTTEVEQTGTDSYEYNIGMLPFGDGSGADTNSTMQVWDGSNWVYVEQFGKWAKGIYTWNAGTSSYDWAALTYDKKINILIGEEVIATQSSTILTFSGTTALSSVNKYFSGSTKLKFINPCSRMKDSDGKKYMMMRSSFNLINDEWSGQWVEVHYSLPTLTHGTLSGQTQLAPPSNWVTPP